MVLMERRGDINQDRKGGRKNKHQGREEGKNTQNNENKLGSNEPKKGALVIPMQARNSNEPKMEDSAPK